VFLAHTGGMPLLASEPEDLSVEAVNEGTIEEAMGTERKGFSGSEAEPSGEELRRRLTLRRAEMGGQGRFLLARVGGEPASVLAFYEGEDRFVHHLATRVPFRACYELGRKSHRNADSTVGLVPSRSTFPAFLSRF
jgi:hypothetical protein